MSGCRNCGAAFGFSQMLCSRCGAWGAGESGPTGVVSRSKVATLDTIAASAIERLVTGRFWDKTFGGGIVPSSSTLIGGSPGQGKTTLLLQIASALASLTGKYSYYLSAEQSPGEIRLTADRLQIPNLDRCVVLTTMGGGVEIDADLLREFPPAIFVLDSLSALHGKDKHGQITTCKTFKKYAVSHGAPAILILHMTKSGDLDGLLTLQHECDCIVGLDPAPDRWGPGVRELLAHKNRFGPSHQPVYVLMTEMGLVEAPPREKRKGARVANDQPAPIDRAPELEPEHPDDDEEPEPPPREPARALPAPDAIVGPDGQRLVRRKPKRTVIDIDEARPPKSPTETEPPPEAS